MVMPLSLALRRHKRGDGSGGDGFQTMDDASEVSSGVFSSSGGPGVSHGQRLLRRAQHQQQPAPSSLLGDMGGDEQGEQKFPSTEEGEAEGNGKGSPLNTKTTFKQRMASFGRMYGGTGGGHATGAKDVGGGSAPSPKPTKGPLSKSPTSVAAGTGPASPQPNKETPSPHSAKARLLRHLMGHNARASNGGGAADNDDDAATTCTAANRRETASTHEGETEDGSVAERSPPHMKRPSLLNPPSLADLSTVLQAAGGEDKPRRSRRHRPSSPPAKPSLVSPPSLADVNTALQEQEVFKTKKSTNKPPPDQGRKSPHNRRQIAAPQGGEQSFSHRSEEADDDAHESHDDDGVVIDRVMSSASRAKTRRSRSSGSSSVSPSRTATAATLNRIQSIRGAHSSLTLTLDRPAEPDARRDRHRDTQSVHPDLLKSPGPKTPTRQHSQAASLQKRVGSAKSPRSPTTSSAVTPSSGAPTLDTRLSTPLDVPERRSRHGLPLRDDDVEAPQHLRRAIAGSASTGAVRQQAPPLEPPGRQRRAVSHSPLPRRPAATSRHSSSGGCGKDSLPTSSPAQLDTPEQSSRHTVAHEGDAEARVSSRRAAATVAVAAGEPITPGRPQRRAVSHSPSPRHPLTPQTPKTPTLEAALPMSGSRLLNRAASSASSTSPGSVSDPSVERIMKMLQDISPKGSGTKSTSSSPNSNASEDESEVLPPAAQIGSSGSAPRSGTTKKRRIKISASLLLSDDDEDPIDPRALIQAVANSPSKQIRGGRVELLKKEMLEEVKAARSRTPKSKRIASTAPNTPTKPPSSSNRSTRTVSALEASLAESGNDSVSGHRSIERSQSQKSVSDKSSTTITPVKQVRRVHSSRTVAKSTSPRTPPRSHSDGYGPSDHERKARLPHSPSGAHATEAPERGSERKSPRTPTRTASGDKSLADPERKTSRSPRTPSRRTSNGSHDSHDRPINRSLHKSRSGRRPGSRKNLLEESQEGGAQLDTGSSPSRRSNRSLQSEADADDEPILVQPVEGRKVNKMLIADMDVDSGGAVFAQLQIPGMDSHHRGMAVQYEDC